MLFSATLVNTIEQQLSVLELADRARVLRMGVIVRAILRYCRLVSMLNYIAVAIANHADAAIAGSITCVFQAAVGAFNIFVCYDLHATVELFKGRAAAAA